MKYILALDQGTTSSRAILFDHEGLIRGMAQHPFRQLYPRQGWVEHDPLDIWATQSGVMSEVLARANVKPNEVGAVGITNQRETTIVWNRETGEPVYNAIVWQSRQTAGLCERLKAEGLEETIRQKTGLVIDAYFSATKIQWILDQVEGARDLAEQGKLLFGTVDTWLVWKLTSGRAHVTDYSNASRTMLFNIHDGCWDDELLELFRIPRSMLPEVRMSSEVYGTARIEDVDVPVAGIAGDQQAALFGQACYQPGMAKNTYGTGAFLLLHTGARAVESSCGMLTTIAWGINGKIEYALEGSVFIAGAAVQWLRDELGFIRDAADTEYFATKVADSNGVYVVPAFTGLGAPYWDMYATGVITGLSRGANRNHIIRATLESIAYQSADVLEVMAREAKIELSELRVDGGASVNNFLMQFQADILDAPVVRPSITETTARGAACLAGLAVGFWKDRGEIQSQWKLERRFEPQLDAAARLALRQGWLAAVEKTKTPAPAHSR
ncbi:MAG: glycerol kinase [Spartobacteria bacterium]|nr:glycerol kinase [Spartobacteria bacterium]